MTDAHWPAADARFTADPRWLGGDDAYTVQLADDLTLWLFGDSFIAEPGQERAQARVVHSSIALQRGLDLADCDFTFQWRTGQAGEPQSLVETGDATWLWPGDGIVVDGRLLLFFMHVRSTRPDLEDMDAAWEAEGSLGFFDCFGWQAFLVADPRAPIDDWVFAPVRRPAHSHDAVIGSAVIRDGEHILAFGYTPAGALLCRWPVSLTAQGDLSQPQWWTGEGWSEYGDPVVVLPGALTEFTVHQRADGSWVQTEVTGLAEPDASVSLRFAPRPEGPWSAARPVQRVTGPPGALLYAGKAHPELVGNGLVVTHASIGLTRAETLADRGLYVPRVVTVQDTVAPK